MGAPARILKPDPQPLSFIVSTAMTSVPGRPTTDCFVGPSYAYRDRDFDELPMKDQPDSTARVVTALALGQEMSFFETIWEVAPNSRGVRDRALLGLQLLGYCCYTMTLPLGQKMARDAWPKTTNGMQTGGGGNYFLTETGDPASPVALVRMQCRSGKWYVVVLEPDERMMLDGSSTLLIPNMTSDLIAAFKS